MNRRRLPPSLQLLAGLLLALLLAAAVVHLATAQRWFGLVLAPQDGGVQLRALHGNAPEGLTLPRMLQAVSADGHHMALMAQDVIEEPDAIADHAELHRFLQRQQRLHALMQGDALVLTLDGAGQEVVLRGAATRPLASLPLDFWIQLVTGLGGFAIACWVLVLSRQREPAWCLMLTGVALMLAAFSAAIYSSRELALPAELLRRLMVVNHAGSVGFGFALVALFLRFPTPLAGRRWLGVLALLYLLWLLLEAGGWTLSPQLHSYATVLLLSGAIVALLFWQWRRSRQQPLARSALRWFGVATLLTICLFIFVQAVPYMLGGEPLLSQGSTFGFFLILYAGLVFGLRRHRLFELDRWAFRVLYWALAALALVVLDLLFLAVFGLARQPALLAAFLVCGLLYLPLRAWLWQRWAVRREPDPEERFRRIVEIALAPSDMVYQQRWQALLRRLFDPLHLEPTEALDGPVLVEDGLALALPATQHSAPLRLAYAEQGRRLFSGRDLALVREMLEMLAWVDENRDAWQRGARHERKRIAQDLHDDLGARLLTALHQSRLPQVHDTVGLALADMRSIVRGLSGQALSLQQVLAELRQECQQRCDAAGLDLHWPLVPGAEAHTLEYETYRHLTSLLRELLSNLIRYAGASRLEVQAAVQDGCLRACLLSDGRPFGGSARSTGLGLTGLRQRVQRLSGSLEFEPLEGGTRVHLVLRLGA